MLILDTDHLTLLERGSGDSLTLQMRLDRVPEEEITTTIITYEEQMRGWLSRVAQADRMDKMLVAYARLLTHVQTFRDIRLLPFERSDATEFERLRTARIRIGTMDLKIAAICLANDATLLTRNLSDFGRIPNLRVEDWSI